MISAAAFIVVTVNFLSNGFTVVLFFYENIFVNKLITFKIYLLSGVLGMKRTFLSFFKNRKVFKVFMCSKTPKKEAF